MMTADSYSFRRRACLLFLLVLTLRATFASGLEIGRAHV